MKNKYHYSEEEYKKWLDTENYTKIEVKNETSFQKWWKYHLDSFESNKAVVFSPAEHELLLNMFKERKLYSLSSKYLYAYKPEPIYDKKFDNTSDKFLNVTGTKQAMSLDLFIELSNIANKQRNDVSPYIPQVSLETCEVYYSDIYQGTINYFQLIQIRANVKNKIVENKYKFVFKNKETLYIDENEPYCTIPENPITTQVSDLLFQLL